LTDRFGHRRARGGSARRRSASLRGLRLVLASLVLYPLVLGPEVALAMTARVRVLLVEEERGSLVIVTKAGKRIELSRAENGLRVNGGTTRRTWSSQGDGPFRVLSGSGQSRTFRVRGKLHVRGSGKGLAVVNEVPLETYLEGTLGAEMYTTWNDHALRAQAVASRTYVVHQMQANGHKPYDVRADVNSQVYRGLDAETESVSRAVSATRGEVLTHSGRPVLAAFHSASGGRTASAEEVWGESVPYLGTIEVENEDESPDTYWRAAASPRTLGRVASALGHSIGDVYSARITRKSDSGRVLELELRGDAGRARVGGRSLRETLGNDILKSTLFEVRNGDAGVVFVGSGRGHRGGMSQWAAQAMAQRGASYREILRTFYPGTRIQRAKDLQIIRTAPVAAGARH
jgi:SpoIID/LytB domain protein